MGDYSSKCITQFGYTNYYIVDTNNPLKPYMFKCDECGYECDYEEDMEDHIYSVHNSEPLFSEPIND